MQYVEDHFSRLTTSLADMARPPSLFEPFGHRRAVGRALGFSF